MIIICSICLNNELVDVKFFLYNIVKLCGVGYCYILK